MLDFTNLPVRLDSLDHWYLFSWIGYANFYMGWLYDLQVSLQSSVIVMIKCHSHRSATHTFNNWNTHTYTKSSPCGNDCGKWTWVSRHCVLAAVEGILCDRLKEVRWSLRGELYINQNIVEHGLKWVYHCVCVCVTSQNLGDTFSDPLLPWPIRKTYCWHKTYFLSLAARYFPIMSELRHGMVFSFLPKTSQNLRDTVSHPQPWPVC